jgi:ribonucleotide reductase beta subunit family protein with ferritin-like domain
MSEKTFLGECLGVQIEKGEETQIQILVEDDGNWHLLDGSFSIHWLDELIEALNDAKKWAEKNDPQH